MLDRFTLKQNFYQLCDQYGLDYAKTYVYKKGTPLDFELDLSFPVVLKPSDTVSYNAVSYTHLDVYKRQDRRVFRFIFSKDKVIAVG